MPRSKEGQEELAKRVATVHAQLIYNYISRLECSTEQKVALLDAIQKNIHDEIKKEKEVEAVDEDKPKRRRRLSTENIKEEQYDINPDDAWRLIFIDKNRNSSDGKIILARLDGEHGIFECVGYANHVYEGRLRGY